MSCGSAGKNKYHYTGNAVGDLNSTGDYNSCAGGPAGSGLSAGTTVPVFVPNTLNRRIWEGENAKLNDLLLDATYPAIALNWIVEITLGSQTFRLSDKAFYVQDADGSSRYYEPRVSKPPAVNVTVGEWLTPNYQVSDLALSINNRDGFFNPYLPHGASFVPWSGSDVVVKIGFGEKYDNYFTLFEGKITSNQGLDGSRDEIDIRAYSKLHQDAVPIPPNAYSADTYSTIDSNDAGKAIPLVYGDWTENVPTWGAVGAICTNAGDVNPDSYNFKISEMSLQSLDSVWLHRGDRVADKPRGPISITDSAINRNIASGEFDLDTGAPVLDDPYTIVDTVRAAAGSGLNFITSSQDLDFVDRGVSVGDIVTKDSATASSLNVGNLKFTAKVSGAGGNAITIELVLLAPVAFGTPPVLGTSSDQTHNLVTVVGNAISIGIPQIYDSDLITVIAGVDKASHIKTAVLANTQAKALVHVDYIGTVPFGYPFNTKNSGVVQAPFAATHLAAGTDRLPCEITAVTNYQITMTGGVTFAENDEYSITSYQYAFMSGDKFSVVCSGKSLSNMSATRLTDASSAITDPHGVAVGADATYWVCDDATQAIYNITFENEILQTISYADIDPSVTSLSGISVANDSKIWVVDSVLNEVFRYDYAEGGTGLSFTIASVTGIGAPFTETTGIAFTSGNKLWVIDKPTRVAVQIDPFAGTNPLVVSSFTADSTLTEILGIAYDEVTTEIVAVDRTTNTSARLNSTTGAIVASIDLTLLDSEVEFVTGVSVGKDETLFFLDQDTLTVYNYNDLSYVSENPCFVARDLLQKFGGHTYDQFDLSWNQTASQLSTYKCRAVIASTTDVATFINALLKQFNTVFHLRFGKYGLFWLDFSNFKANGRLVKEKDIKIGTFKAQKEPDQYFNSATASYGTTPFDDGKFTSDTYVSPAGISSSLAGVVNKSLELPHIYRREDLDKVMPLFVRLAVPDPEFIQVSFGFRVLRSQMQDFLTLTFDGDVNLNTGLKDSGRRFDNIPCMIRSLNYDLGPMTVGMKLWSLGMVRFPGYTPPGATVGGFDDPIGLTSIGRLGRFSPTGTITAHSSSTVTLTTVGGQNAETRTATGAGLAWAPGYKCDLVDGSTKAILQSGLTIDSVSANVVTFVEPITATVTNTSANAAGFVTGGVLLQYSTYDMETTTQKGIYAFFSRPSDTYPTNTTRELEEQRGGLHSFADGSLPYVLYPESFVSY